MIALTPARLAFAVTVIAAIVLTAIAATGALMPGDRAIADALQATPGASFFDAIADFIAPKYFEFSVVAIAAAYAAFKRDYALAAVGLIAIAATYLNPGVKALIERPRPGPDDVIVREALGGYGYPSGHVWSATLTFGYAIVVALRHTTGAARVAVVAACAAAIAVIAWDRVWDGVHWPSDTLGAFTICAPALAAAVALTTVFRQQRPAESDKANRTAPSAPGTSAPPPLRDSA